MRNDGTEIRNTNREAVNPITEGVIWKQLLLYFVPLLGASFLQLLYNTADTIIVGRSGGAGVILSQAYGAKNEKLLDDGLHNAVALALVLGTVFMTAGLIVSGPVLRLAGAPQETMKESVLYLRIVLCGLISNALYNMGASALRAVGDSKRPFRFLLFCSVLNIALDLLLVAGLGLGIGGAALATILSQTLSALLVLRTLIRGTGRELMPCLNPRRLRLQRDMALKMLRLGLPLGFETLMYTFSCVVLTSAVNTFGTDTVAAYAGFVRIESFYWMLEVALSVSITTFAGQNLGAGRMDRVHRVVREGAVLMYLLMGMTIVIMYTGCPVWLGLFTTDAGVISIGVDMMRYLLPFYILYVPSGLFFATLRGMGESLRPTLITFFGVCVLRILWVAFVFPRASSIRVLLFCFPVSWTVTSVTYAFYYSWFMRKRAK